LIAQHIKLPSQFAAIAPKVRDFFAYKAFAKELCTFFATIFFLKAIILIGSKYLKVLQSLFEQLIATQ